MQFSSSSLSLLVFFELSKKVIFLLVKYYPQMLPPSDTSVPPISSSHHLSLKFVTPPKTLIDSGIHSTFYLHDSLFHYNSSPVLSPHFEFYVITISTRLCED